MNDREGDGATETPRQQEATSKETLGDLESDERGAASAPGGASSDERGETQAETPSPDGAFDEPRGGRADGGDAGGPM